MMLSARLLLAPILLSNILLALLIALIALAYLEEDGVVLSIGLLVGFVVLAVDLVVVWEIIDGAKRIGRGTLLNLSDFHMWKQSRAVCF